jgi:transcriptional activator of cad operon
MERPTNIILRIGDWRVNPSSGELSRNGVTTRVEARTMRLLLCLAERSGEVVSIEELLDKVWSGVTVSSDSVYQAVASLRRLLGDDPKQPTYIATVPRLGYCMLATVSPWTDSINSQTGPATAAAMLTTAGSAPIADEESGWRRRSANIWTIGGAVCVTLILAFLLYRGISLKNHAAQGLPAALPQKSIAVLPFVDLTADMKEEEFADGLTEEIIDKLSKDPDIRVPAAAASFYFKYKKSPIAEIAKTLGVVYVLDGSTRQSGNSVRIAARLVRAENGYVIWSETYDRSFVHRVAVQDEIASEVTKALRASIERAPSADRPSR